MRLDNEHTYFSRLLKLGLIALVVYLSQVYPYVHFHHAHAGTDRAVKLSVLSADVEPVHSHHAHDHDNDHEAPHHQSDNTHHHHNFDQHLDWHLARTHANSLLSHISFAYISVQVETVPIRASSPRYHTVISTPLPASVTPDGIDTRGPPVLG